MTTMTVHQIAIASESRLVDAVAAVVVRDPEERGGNDSCGQRPDRAMDEASRRTSVTLLGGAAGLSQG